jgi:hypothetical protein
MPEPGNVFALDRVRIERGIAQRERYKYVVPRVEQEGLGWKIVSPNCSRNIDPQGGESTSPGWCRRAMAAGCCTRATMRSAAGSCASPGSRWPMRWPVCADPAREFWQ